MKIITWNINGYRSITGQNPSKRYDKINNENKLFDFIKNSNPDIICLQETKANIEQISEELRFPKDFSGEYFSAQRKGYSGVATFVKQNNNMEGRMQYAPTKPQFNDRRGVLHTPCNNTPCKDESNHQNGFGIEKFDAEGRVIATHFSDFSLLNVYFPNGKKDEIRLQYKLDFYKSLFDYAEKLRKTQPNIIICGDYNTAHKPIDLARPKENEKISGFLPIEREKLRKTQPNIIICGDYNTAHKPIDLARPKENEKISGFLPIEREKLDEICSLGYVDAFRIFNKEAEQYSWWSNLGQARARNVGWRIDYFFVTENLVPQIKNCYLEPTVFGSDHCPVVLEL